MKGFCTNFVFIVLALVAFTNCGSTGDLYHPWLKESLSGYHEYVEITQEEANCISINPFTGHSKKYLVVRALYLGNGKFGTYLVDLTTEINELSTMFITRVSGYTQLKEDALIIGVDSIPNKFNVRYDMGSLPY